MFYLYYDDVGNIACVTNMIDDSFGPNYIDVDFQTYEDFSNSTKHLSDYNVIKNSKVAGKMHVVLRGIDNQDTDIQPKGIISKQEMIDNAVVLTQDTSNGTWSATSTMNDINCSLFAQGDDHIREYYVVDNTNRFILLDTFQVNLKTLAAYDTVTIKNYDKDVCKQQVSLLCKSHHVKHIHIVQE
tara:strand:- start:540 stop:1094 length:555 start_codon:yes stop_codon:yes gene_type:complete